MIKEYTLKNNDLEVSFINIGATVTKIVDLKTGVNVIVGHENLNDYIENSGYMNSIIGRHSGRIPDFTLDGKHYELNKNGDGFQLHGGVKGFNFKCFDVVEMENKIEFSTTSPHLEEGFPGDVQFKITYSLIGNELHLDYEAISNEKTIFNFTNHAYFNLSGSPKNSILDHELTINADHYVELEENLLPKKIVHVENTPFDFRESKAVGRDIEVIDEQLKIGQGYDHPYIINKSADLNHIASLKSPVSNIKLDIYSDQDAVVCYSGNMISEDTVLNYGIQGKPYCGICLETQSVPNSLHIKGLEDKITYEANERYTQKTIWKITKDY